MGSPILRSGDGRSLDAVLRQPLPLALLTYLAATASGSYCTRDRLVGLFWPDRPERRARASLSEALWRLRRELGPDVIITRSTAEVGIDPDRLWCDLVALDEAADRDDLAGLLDLYRGDLLDGMILGGAGEFDRWAELQSGRLRRLAVHAAAALAGRALEAGDAEAPALAERYLALAPYDEGAVQALMRAEIMLGRPELALAAFQRFRQALLDHRGREPSEETTSLVRELESAPAAEADAPDRRAGVRSPRTALKRKARRSGPIGVEGIAPAPARRHPAIAPAIGAAAFVAGLIAIAAWQRGRSTYASVEPTMVTTSALAINMLPYSDFEPGPADMGIVYRPAVGMGLWYKAWDERFGAPIPGAEPSNYYGVSPDGRTVVFGPGRPSKILTLPNGVPRPFLTRVRGARGAGVESDGYFYFDWQGGLARAPLAGGEPERLLQLRDGETQHRNVVLLPGHRSLLFTVVSEDPESVSIHALDLATLERSRVVEGMGPQYSEPTGHIVYATPDRRLMALPFDVETLRATGVPRQLAPEAFGWGAQSMHRLTSDGLFMYWEAPETEYEFVWADRSGHTTPVEPGWVIHPGGGHAGWSLSPGDSMIAWRETVGDAQHIWVKHLTDGAAWAVTTGPGRNHRPRWSVDGKSVVYQSDWRLFEAGVSGTRPPRRLVEDFQGRLVDGLWGSSGTWFLAWAITDKGNGIVGLRPGIDEGLREIMPIQTETVTYEVQPHLSPDGRWLAYESNENGQGAIRVRPFPDVENNIWRISPGRGVQPRWSGDGRELFFVDHASMTMMVAHIDTSDGFRFTVEELFTLPTDILWHRNRDFYDVTEDGQRFLLARPLEREATLVMYTNFFEYLRRLDGE